MQSQETAEAYTSNSANLSTFVASPLTQRGNVLALGKACTVKSEACKYLA
jgi:hypothetical protein